MKANGRQTAVKLTASKISTQVMVWVFTKYGEWCLHQVVTKMLPLHVTLKAVVNRV